MIITNEPKGLSFHDWIDVLLSVPDDSVLGNPFLDLDLVSRDETWEHRRFWISFLLSYRDAYSTLLGAVGTKLSDVQVNQSQPVPLIIREAKGIGAWYNPELVIVIDKIQCILEPGHPYWDLPNHKRLRPFMENRKALRFFYLLCRNVNPLNTYVTCVSKDWVQDRSNKTFQAEMEHLFNADKVKRLIKLGSPLPNQAFTIYRDRLTTLPYPTFYTNDHSVEWKQFRETFNKMVP